MDILNVMLLRIMYQVSKKTGVHIWWGSLRLTSSNEDHAMDKHIVQVVHFMHAFSVHLLNLTIYNVSILLISCDTNLCQHI